MNPTISVIIVTCNSAPHIGACLESVRALRYDPLPQVVVVDNASQDESLALVRHTLSEAIIVPHQRNQGFASGVNAGVAASTGEIIVLLNPDAVVDPHWLDGLVAALANQQCGAAGSKILDRDGRLLLHTGGLVNSSTFLTLHRGAGEEDRGQYDAVAPVPYLTGAALALRRAVWDRVGGMDEGFYPAYFEDLDLCLRLQDRGLVCSYIPHSVLRHTESTTTGKHTGTFYYYYHRNRFRIACKRMSWADLWETFCPSEATRLQEACLLDRLVAALVYRQSLPRGLVLPTIAEQDSVLAVGTVLSGAQRDTPPEQWNEAAQKLLGIQPHVRAQLTALLEEAQREAVLHEHTFSSRVPLVASLRQSWNNIAPRWYMLPVLHQQTRANLAMSRGLEHLVTQIETDYTTLATLVAQAVLCFRMAENETLPVRSLLP